MNEQEWLTSTDPQAMLWALTPQRPTLHPHGGRGHLPLPRPSDRKLRLFAAACYLTATSSKSIGQAAAEVALRWAETGRPPGADEPNTRNDWAVNFADAAGHARSALAWSEMWDENLPLKAALLRDIAGNPFRPVAFEPHWLSWHGGCVVQLARAVYDERRFDHLPILADALEEAGADCAEILAHLRSPGPHVRGCWVLDLLLGKE